MSSRSQRQGKKNRATRARRQQPHRRTRQQGLLEGRLPLIGGAAIVLILIVAIAIGRLMGSGNTAQGAGQPIAGIECSETEQVNYHVHAHLAIFVNGQEQTVPANIGIEPTCLYWLHTHDASGVIHVEAPQQGDYTLGQFFDIWGQPLSSTELLDHKADAQHQVVAYVNGRKFDGSLRDIPITPHAVIVLEYGPPFVAPPSYTFPQGL